jgi:hypothetical protein
MQSLDAYFYSAWTSNVTWHLKFSDTYLYRISIIAPVSASIALAFPELLPIAVLKAASMLCLMLAAYPETVV